MLRVLVLRNSLLTASGNPHAQFNVNVTHILQFFISHRHTTFTRNTRWLWVSGFDSRSCASSAGPLTTPFVYLQTISSTGYNFWYTCNNNIQTLFVFECFQCHRPPTQKKNFRSPKKYFFFRRISGHFRQLDDILQEHTIVNCQQYRCQIWSLQYKDYITSTATKIPYLFCPCFLTFLDPIPFGGSGGGKFLNFYMLTGEF